MRRAALLVLAVLLAGGAAAAEGEAWSHDLERELMSPYCPGRSLVECPSPAATDLRLWIQAREREGASRASVEAALFEKYGDVLRHAPRAEGWGLLAYLVPGGAVLAGGVIVAVFLRRGAGSSRPAARSTPRDPELEREIDRELGAS